MYSLSGGKTSVQWLPTYKPLHCVNSVPKGTRKAVQQTQELQSSPGLSLRPRVHRVCSADSGATVCGAQISNPNHPQQNQFIHNGASPQPPSW
mmetsp:Transcript_34478/g.57526  ORF Transcript_34478/g.57526 Transcript_34478/m.57526 type:complete len:93 (+) Transcript_34478:295-573(+)